MKPIGAGGMAEVFLALQTVGAGVERPVVIKRMMAELASDPFFVSMFVQEAHVAAQLQHPNIVQIYDVVVAGTCPCIVMEYLDGFDVRWLTRRSLEHGRPVPPGAVAAVGAGAAHGLGYAHRKRGLDGKPLGIVHRDISPHNLFVTRDGVVKVVDFGIARSGEQVTATQEGAIKGKLPYMSPEQVRGEPVEASSDLFSLGVVLWETATGRRLFKRDSVEDVIRAIVASPIPAPSSVAPELPARFDRIVARALAREREVRYATAEDLAEDLDELAQELKSGSSQILLSRLMERLVRPGEESARLPVSEIDTGMVTVLAKVATFESGEREVSAVPDEPGPRPPTSETLVEGMGARPRLSVPTAEGGFEGPSPVATSGEPSAIAARAQPDGRASSPRSAVPTTFGGFEANGPPMNDAPSTARPAAPPRHGDLAGPSSTGDPIEQALAVVEARLDLESGPARRAAPSVYGHDFEPVEPASAPLDLAVDVARERKAQVCLADIDRRARSVAAFGAVPGLLGAPAYALRVRRRLAWLRRRAAILRVAVRTARAEWIEAFAKIGEEIRSISSGRPELGLLVDEIAHAERQVGIRVTEVEAGDADDRVRELVAAARTALRARLADLGKRAVDLAIVDPASPAAARARSAEDRALERSRDLELYERAQCMFDPAAVRRGWTVMGWSAAIVAVGAAVVYALGPL